jgi:predicted GNAT superfamily acetyltransferase
MDEGIEIRPVQSQAEILQVEAVQSRIWPSDEIDVVPAHILQAIRSHGGVLIGAFEKDQLVGFVLGFLGADSRSSERVAMARLEHYSHELGVLPEYRGRGIGFALKLAQREHVLQQGVRLITWTYDPLLSLNAQLNIRQLGAVCDRYTPDAYGEMRDALNTGLASDRFVVDWWVTSNRVEARLAGERKPLDLAHFLSAGAEKINPATLGSDDFVHPAEELFYPSGTFALIEIPSDFAKLRAKDLGLAAAWREQTREIFLHVFEQGYLVTDFIFLRGETFPRSYYILSYGETTFG